MFLFHNVINVTVKLSIITLLESFSTVTMWLWEIELCLEGQQDFSYFNLNEDMFSYKIT